MSMETSKTTKIFSLLFFGVVLALAIAIPKVTSAADIPAAVSNVCGTNSYLNVPNNIVQLSDGTYQCQVQTGYGTADAPAPMRDDRYDANGNHLGSSNVVGGLTSGPTAGSGGEDPNGCSVLAPGKFFQDCIWFPLMSWLGSWFLTIGAFLLWVAGWLFDILVQYVIIAFGSTLNTLQISGAINTGWTVFRDVANILIIGIFTFIALSIILGISKFNDKKLVANVLIVAVLLNFSLLFTKMIIDASNFVSYQLYTATAITYNHGATATSITNFDIAGAFLQPLGITSIWHTESLTQAAGQSTNLTGTSGWRAFLYGLAGGLMLSGIAFVLFYGCFQIAARAVTMIFLMLTSSIAFASYLVPKFADGDYGWKAWWGALLNAGIFAPLLMVFLFVAMLILQAAGSVINPNNVNQNNFANVLSAPFSGAQAISAGGNNAWQLIFTYIIVLGILYAAIKVSSHVASSLGTGIVSAGMSLAASAATGGVGLASRFVAAPVLRRTVGAGAMARAEVREKQAKEASTQMLDLKSQGYNTEARQMARVAMRRKSQQARNTRIADSKMNIMDTKPVKRITKGLGLTGILSGQSSERTLSYAGREKQNEEAIKKLVESIKPDVDGMKQAKREEIYNLNKEAYRTKLEARDAAKREADEAEKHAKLVGGKEAGATKDHEDRLIEEVRKLATTNAQAGIKYNPDLVAHDQSKSVIDEARTGWKQALNEAIGKLGEADRTKFEQKMAALPSDASAKDLRTVQDELMKTVKNTDLQKEITQQINSAKGERESSMRKEEVKIQEARKKIVDAAKSDTEVETAGGTQLADLKTKVTTAQNDTKAAKAHAKELKDDANRAVTDLRNFVASVRHDVQEAEKEINENVANVMPVTAEAAARQSLPWYRRAVPIRRSTERLAEDKIVSKLKKDAHTKYAQDVFAGYVEREGGGEGGAAAAGGGH